MTMARNVTGEGRMTNEAKYKAALEEIRDRFDCEFETSGGTCRHGENALMGDDWCQHCIAADALEGDDE